MVVRTYEFIRASGVCNMFDANCVANVADRIGCPELAEVTRDRKAYSYLLQNFGRLMKLYGIEQKDKPA